MLRLPAFIHLEVTDVCNLRCAHCFRFDVANKPPSRDLGKAKTLELLNRLIAGGIYSLTITGGEPLTCSELTLEAVRIAKAAGLHVVVNTNLLLATSDLVYELRRLGLDSMLVSCPASDSELYQSITRGGSYERFEQNLEMLTNAKIHALVNMVVTQANFGMMEKTASRMAALGVKRFALTPASMNIHAPDRDQLLSPEQINTLFETLRWCRESLGMQVDIVEPLPKCLFPAWCFEGGYDFTRRACVAGRKSASVSNIGEVRPCAHNPRSYGNVFENTLELIWERMSEYRDESVPVMCRACAALSQCNGACRIFSLAEHGVLNMPERLARGPVSLPRKNESRLHFEDCVVFTFKGRFRFRREMDGYYSIVSNGNGSNLMVVNKELFEFAGWLSKNSPVTFEQVSARAPSGVAKRALAGILYSLICNGFVTAQPSQS